MAIGWNFPHKTPAQLLAFVLLKRDIVWLLADRRINRCSRTLSRQVAVDTVGRWTPTRRSPTT
jgi:hypothetical protein